MDAKTLKERLEQIFKQENWTFTWDREQDKFSLQFPEQIKPVEVSVRRLLQRIQDEQLPVDDGIDEIVQSIKIMVQTAEARKLTSLDHQQNQIYPVMRSSSFPVETSNGKTLVHDDHTAETRVYYALDLGRSYTLIDEDMLIEAGWSKQELKERALFNLRSLSNDTKVDTVAGNYFYFISTTDGYAASRILNQSLIHEYVQKAEGDLCIAIPHQDVLIFADLRNEAGYDVLGQMGFHFYTKGNIPITALPFQYKEGQLEPIFILAKRKPKSDS